MAPRQDSMDSENYEVIEVGPDLPHAKRKVLAGKIVIFSCFALIIALFFTVFAYPDIQAGRSGLTAAAAALFVCAVAAAALYIAYRREIRTMADDTERVILGQDTMVLEKHESKRRIPYERIVHVAVRYAFGQSKREISVSHRRVEMEMFREDGTIIDSVRGGFSVINTLADKIRQQVWWASGMEDTVGDQQSDREIRIEQKKPLLRVGRILGTVVFLVSLALLAHAFYMEYGRRQILENGREASGIVTKILPGMGNRMVHYIYLGGGNISYNGAGWLPEELSEDLEPGSTVPVLFLKDTPSVSTLQQGTAPINLWLIALFLLPVALLSLLCALKYDIAWVDRRPVIMRPDQLAEDFLTS